MEKFSSNKKCKKNKFIQKKDCCMQSLKDVNVFLCNLKQVKKGIILYKLFK